MQNDVFYNRCMAAIMKLIEKYLVESITVVYNQTFTVYEDTPLDDLKADLVVTAEYADGTTEEVPADRYTLSGTLEVGTSTITVVYGGKSATFNVTVAHNQSQGELFGTFTSGYSISKKYNSSQGGEDMPLNAVWVSSTAGRAAITVPVENRGYTLTVTDASKYSLYISPLQSNTAVPTPYLSAVLHEYFQGLEKTQTWVTTDTDTTAPYILIALKRNSGDFTISELANGAEAVFTYTVSES